MSIAQTIFFVQVIHDYQSEEDDELTIGNGEILSILKKNENGWWFAESEDGQCGWIPSNFVKMLDTGLLGTIRVSEAQVFGTIEFSGITCKACTEIISAEYICLGNSRRFHRGCFNCAVCYLNLEKLGVLEKDGKLYCERDFVAKFSPKCSDCKFAVLDQYVIFNQRIYHPEHLRCAACLIQLDGDEVFEADNLAYCKEHFQEFIAPKCAHCKNGITGKGIALKDINQSFHQECFYCNCDEKHKLKEGDSIYLNGGLIYCKEHFMDKVCAKCFRCKGNIDGEYASSDCAKDKQFHLACFNCDSCGVSIINGNFTFLSDKFFCFSCASMEKQKSGVSRDLPDQSSCKKKSDIDFEVFSQIFANQNTMDKHPSSVGRKPPVSHRPPEFIDPSEKSFPYQILKSKESLPQGINPSCKERYLSEHEFKSVFDMSKTAFYRIPRWRQLQQKQEKLLF